MIVQQSMRKAKAKAFFKLFLRDSIAVVTVLFFLFDLLTLATIFAYWAVQQLLCMAYFILRTKD